MKSIITSIALAAAMVATPALGKDKLLLKTPVAFSTALPGLGTPIPRVAEEVSIMSGGTLKMKVYEPGKLVPAFEILDAVSSGKINSGCPGMENAQNLTCVKRFTCRNLVMRICEQS